MRTQAESNEAFEAAMLKETGEIKELIHKLVPEIDAVVAKHVGGVSDELRLLREELSKTRLANTDDLANDSTIVEQ